MTRRKRKSKKFKEYYGNWDGKVNGVQVKKRGKHSVEKV